MYSKYTRLEKKNPHLNVSIGAITAVKKNPVTMKLENGSNSWGGVGGVRGGRGQVAAGAGPVRAAQFRSAR